MNCYSSLQVLNLALRLETQYHSNVLNGFTFGFTFGHMTAGFQLVQSLRIIRANTIFHQDLTGQLTLFIWKLHVLEIHLAEELDWQVCWTCSSVLFEPHVFQIKIIEF